MMAKDIQKQIRLAKFGQGFSAIAGIVSILYYILSDGTWVGPAAAAILYLVSKGYERNLLEDGGSDAG